MDIYNDKIRPLFQKTGLPDYELEEKIGLPRSSIYKWEKNISKSYKKYYPEISSFFNLSMDYFSENVQKNKLNTEADEPLELLDILKNEESLMFNGVPLSDSDRESIIAAITMAKQIIDKSRNQ
ncbi:MAG: helix-turn-helix transcriptional regulator [Clostridium sp.]|nr:helix-turn-helix transcriptional regulator [Clostridium sp.]